MQNQQNTRQCWKKVHSKSKVNWSGILKINISKRSEFQNGRKCSLQLDWVISDVFIIAEEINIFNLRRQTTTHKELFILAFHLLLISSEFIVCCHVLQQNESIMNCISTAHLAIRWTLHNLCISIIPVRALKSDTEVPSQDGR